MKSAYELAMERLEKSSGPSRKLSDEQKQLIADIDKKYDAQLAAVRLDLETKLSQAGTPGEVHEIQGALASEVRALEEKRESEKNAVWEQA